MEQGGRFAVMKDVPKMLRMEEYVSNMVQRRRVILAVMKDVPIRL